MPGFAVSIVVLSLVQAAVVALPRAVPRAGRVRGWALLPPASIVVFAVVVGAWHGAASLLTYLALVAVPLLAAVALGWAMRGARPLLAAGTAALFALAWADRGLAGEASGVVLGALSVVPIAVVLAAVAPRRALEAGIVAMAVADAAFVIADLLQRPNGILDAARPAAGLPRLQREAFGSAVLGYGDLFVAALLGAVLARDRARQLAATVLCAVFALSFDLLFFVAPELPATVPVAVALVVMESRSRVAGSRRPP